MFPSQNTVPSPEKFIGRIMGAPGELLGTEKTYAYAGALAAASSRVRVFTIGHSEEGREILMLAIADEAGIRDLDRIKAATAALADPRRTNQATAESLISTARPIYYLNAALHSDQTGSTEAMLELAFRLAVSEQPMILQIREQLVVLQSHFQSRRPRQNGRLVLPLPQRQHEPPYPAPQSPPYWSKYTFVDINRDSHQQTHETTKAVHRMFYEWHPTVMHDLHEGVPFLMTWNGTGPYNPNIDPSLMPSELNPADGTYLNEFRIHEGLDTSYAKFNRKPDPIDDNPFDKIVPPADLPYVGWTEPGAWFNITVDVTHSGTYAPDFLYTSNRGGTISVDVNGKDVTGPLQITTTNDPADPLAWRQWHHWNLASQLFKVRLSKGEKYSHRTHIEERKHESGLFRLQKGQQMKWKWPGRHRSGHWF
jgi:hypothetical protein